MAQVRISDEALAQLEEGLEDFAGWVAIYDDADREWWRVPCRVAVHGRVACAHYMERPFFHMDRERRVERLRIFFEDGEPVSSDGVYLGFALIKGDTLMLSSGCGADG